jgi:hypothetical protein
MTATEAQRLLDVLKGAYPHRKNVGEDTERVYRTLLADLDYELAQQAVRDVISDIKFWPAFAEIKKAYTRRRSHAIHLEEDEERRALQAEPTEEERLAQLERMQAYIASRWPKVPA